MINFRKRRVLAVVALLVVLLPGLAGAGRATAQAPVHPLVWETLRTQGQSEVLVILREQADTSAARRLPTKLAKGQYVYETLTEVAERSQRELRALLDARGVAYQPFWIVNLIKVEADARLVVELAGRPEVASIWPNPWVRGIPEIEVGQVEAGAPLPTWLPAADRSPGAVSTPSNLVNAEGAPQAIEGGILRSQADDVWDLGYTGQGILVAGQDTGYDWDHPALARHYDGCLDPPTCSSVDHNYHWHDAVHSGGGSCGPDSSIPCDDHGHGTHTMGTIVGDDGGSNQIGMAPGAMWIGCRNMNQGNGSPATYLECFQFFLAPTDLNDNNPRPDLAPDVTNNSWTCPPSEGCADDTLEAAVQAQRDAGIVTVVSAGNEGSSCETVQDPPAIYQQSFSVAAFDHRNDNIASFSSRGPVTYGGDTYRKPDIAGPGVSIRSARRNSSQYTTMSGTSMAGPHVAGCVALFLSAHPSYIGNVAVVEDSLEQSAEPKTTSQGCGGDGSNQVPNNVWGWGIMNCLEAVNNPTAVQLTTFAAGPSGDGALVTWETAAEHDNVGFNLYRSTVLDTPGDQLNISLIPSQSPGGGQGAAYEFLDGTAASGVTYYYVLEDVDTSGVTTPHGPVALTLWRAYLPLISR